MVVAAGGCGLSATPGLIRDEDPGGWVERAVAGDAMGAFAMTEWEAGSDVGSMTTVAVPDGDGFRLNGGKAFISNAGIADFYVVFATTDPDAGTWGISCFVVPADADGFEFTGSLVMSAPHPLGEVRFNDCRVPRGALLGELGGGFRIGMATLDRLRPTVAAAACGMAGRALWEAVEHARGREQFGKRLASFQLIQEKLSSSAIDLTAGRLLAYRAGWEKDRGGPADRGPRGTGSGGAGGACGPSGRPPVPERAGAQDLRGDDRDPAPDRRGRARAGGRAVTGVSSGVAMRGGRGARP